jgi:hypothetical protein
MIVVRYMCGFKTVLHTGAQNWRITFKGHIYSLVVIEVKNVKKNIQGAITSKRQKGLHFIFLKVTLPNSESIF